LLAIYWWLLAVAVEVRILVAAVALAVFFKIKALFLRLAQHIQ
jgi:hypothetical protein